MVQCKCKRYKDNDWCRNNLNLKEPLEYQRNSYEVSKLCKKVNEQFYISIKFYQMVMMEKSMQIYGWKVM